jgi:hypothetical protein
MGPTALLALRRKLCYGFLSPLKIHRPRPGLNPRTIKGILVINIITPNRILQLFFFYYEILIHWKIKSKICTYYCTRLEQPYQVLGPKQRWVCQQQSSELSSYKKDQTYALFYNIMGRWPTKTRNWVTKKTDRGEEESQHRFKAEPWSRIVW